MPNKQVRERGREILLNLYKHTEEPNCPICKDIDQALNRIMELMKGIVPEEVDMGYSGDRIVDMLHNIRNEYGVGFNQCRQLLLERIGGKG